MSDYKSVFDRNRKGIKKLKKFKMTEVQKIILGYRKPKLKDQDGNIKEK